MNLVDKLIKLYTPKFSELKLKSSAISSESFSVIFLNKESISNSPTNRFWILLDFVFPTG